MPITSSSIALARSERFRSGCVRALASLIFAAVAVLGTATEGNLDESVFCASLMLALASLAIALTRRVAFSLLSVAALVLALRGISLIKVRYLGTPLFAPDLVYFSNADTLGVVGEYPKIWHAVIKRSLLGALLLWLCWRFERPLWQARATRVRLGVRLTVASLGAAIYGLAFWPHGPFAPVLAKGVWETINPGSPLTSFVLSFDRMQLTVPVVDAAAADERDWVSTETRAAPAASTLPDIVVVLEESTFDPRTLAVCDRPECDVPMLRADASTRAHGPLRVHTYGGGTWTSEFTFLTGLPNAMFGASGFYAPFNLAPRVATTLPKLLKTQGYRTVALYPLPGNFVNAQRAYAYYGFDAFHDSSEYEIAWESPDSVIEQEFEKLCREERAHTDQPLFFMVLTMRQHGPHTDPYEKLHAPFDRPLFPALDDNRNLNLANYLERLQGSNVAIERLQRVLFDGTRPAVLAHFGDHQPSFDGLLGDMPRTAAAQQFADLHRVTYFMLSANDRVPAATHAYPVLDLGFLAGLILDVAGVRKDAFFEANTRLRERCAGRYLDCPDHATLTSYEAFVFDRLHIIGG